MKAIWIFVVLSASEHVIERREFQTEAECIEYRDSRPVLPASFGHSFGCLVKLVEVAE